MFLVRLPQIIFLHTLLFIVQHIFDAHKKFDHSNVKNTVITNYFSI